MATMTQIEEDSDLQKPSLSSYRSSPLPIVGRTMSCVFSSLLRSTMQCSKYPVAARRRETVTVRPLSLERNALTKILSLIQAGMILIGY